jgi:hypothetical protein
VPCEEEMLASSSWRKAGHEEGWADALPVRWFRSGRLDGWMYILVDGLLATFRYSQSDYHLSDFKYHLSPMHEVSESYSNFKVCPKRIPRFITAI